METTAGAGYAVIVTEAPVTVKAKKTDGTTVDLKVLDSTGQHTFIAMSGETLFEGGSVELGLVQGPFDPARALGGDGGAGSTTVYTLGDDGTYRIIVSATTAEMTRPADADDWFHLRTGLHLHGYNLQHGAGASLFAQGSISASMSARGFNVKDSNVLVFDLDSDDTGAFYMAFNGATIALDASGVAPSTVLHSHAVYTLNVDASVGFDLSALSLAAPLAGGLTTVRLLVSVTGTGGGQQKWADPLTGEGLAAHWLGRSDPSVPPTLEAGKKYHVVLESDGSLTTANLAYDRDLS